MTVPCYFSPSRATSGMQFTGVDQTATRPSIVQSAMNLTTGASPSVTLGSAPTPGNLLVAIGMHWTNNPSAANGYTMIASDNGATYAGNMSASKIAGASESATQTPFTIGANHNCVVVYEIAGAASAEFIAWMREQAGSPLTLQGLADKNDLVLGLFTQGATSNAFTLSGDATSADNEQTSAGTGAGGPYRSQSFHVAPSVVGVSVSATMPTAHRASGMLLRIAPASVGGGGLLLGSTAISSAVEDTRQIVEPIYFEAVAEKIAGVVGVGIASISYTPGAAVLGAGVLNFVYRNDGTVVLNGVTLATISNYVQGDRVSVAYHPGAAMVWFKVNAGSWNNSGTANPATFTEGISVSAYQGGPSYPALSFSVAFGALRACLSSASFLYTPPSGYKTIEDETVLVQVANNPFTGLAPMGMPDMSDGVWFTRGMLPQNDHTRAVSFPAGPVKTIAGGVFEDGVGVEGKRVIIYNRQTGEYVSEARTNSSGEYVIPAIDPNLAHFVVAFDDPEYNAKIYDNVLPG